MKLRLTLDIEYKPNGASEKALREKLVYIAEHAANEGLMTGDEHQAEVLSWEYKVERLV